MQLVVEKYMFIVGFLGKLFVELFIEDIFWGWWLVVKNMVEMINDYLFVYGGLYFDVVKYQWSINVMNQ